MGVWGAGVAQAMKEHYPRAFDVYRRKCNKVKKISAAQHRSELCGTSLLIPPEDYRYHVLQRKGVPPKIHWIACLFTSKRYGRNVDDPDDIALNTEKALKDLQEKILEAQSKGENVGAHIWSVKINGGLFKVPWERSEQKLQDSSLDIVVVERPSSVTPMAAKPETKTLTKAKEIAIDETSLSSKRKRQAVTEEVSEAARGSVKLARSGR